MGRRTAKIRNGETTVYHWQEDTLAIESTNGQNTHYLFEPGTFEPLAQFQTASPIGIGREDKPTEPYSYDPETDPLLKIPPEEIGKIGMGHWLPIIKSITLFLKRHIYETGI